MNADYFEGRPVVMSDGSVRHGYVNYEPWPSLRITGDGSVFLTQQIIDAQSCDQLWPATRLIPAHVLAAVRKIPAHRWALLRLCAYWPQDGLLMVEQCPALAILLCERMGSDYYSSFIERPARRWRDLCRWLGLPDRKGALNLLRKLPMEHCSPTLVGQLAEHLRRGCPWLRTLSHLPTITRDTLALLRMPAEVISTRLLLDSATTPPDEERVAWVVNTVRFLRMENFGDVPWPYQNCGYVQLRKIERTLMARIDASGQEAATFPDPPVRGVAGHIVPITHSPMLLEEGEEQNNCSEIFREEIMRGDCYLYRQLAPERATVRLQRDSETGVWELAEARATNNRSVSPITWAYLKHWLGLAATSKGGAA